MIYTDLVPVVAAAVFVLMLPGTLVAFATGARGWVLLGAGAPASVTIISLTAILTGAAGLPWGVLPVLAVSALIAVGVYVLRLPWSPLPGRRRRRRSGPGASVATLPAQRKIRLLSGHRREWSGRDLAGLTVGSIATAAVFAVISWRLGQAFGGAENISQTFDNIFHLNAVRYIADTGNASSLKLSGFTASSGIGGFYPAAWHDVVSLTQQLAGSSVPAAINGTNVAIAALAWPLSCMLLSTSIFGARRSVVVATAALAAGFSAFPYLMVDFGVLYPNFLSIALMPACIALFALALGVARGSQLRRSTAWLLLLGSLPGLALAHPSTFLALLAWTYPVVLAAMAALSRRLRPRSGALRSYGVFLLGFVAYTGALALAWKKLRPDEAQSTWEPVQALSQAFGQAVTSAPQGRPIPWLIFALTLVGIAGLLQKRRHLWLLWMYGISVLMFMVVSGYPFGPFRTFVGGIWYNDPFRPAALLPVATLPVAVLGFVWLWDRAQALLRDRRTPSGQSLLAGWPSARSATAGTVVLALLALGGLFALSQRGAVTVAVRSAATNYAASQDAALLSTDERILLGRVAEEIPADNTVVSSPWTGASLIYAIADRRSLTPHVFGDYDADTTEVLRRLNQAGEDPSVCQSVRDLKAYYVLDFGAREVHGGHHPFPGSENLSSDPDFKLIDSQGNAKLYKVVACG
ncbi:DUF6541 family protein [Arthrobacter sp. B3I4]|uniref:DUF6541 family protein n=1 Tax=Arthrobacter sp. B3I4 TaxID=3042267 RepID=UPI002784D812|nr:DUF6541 family protein [Arthrobacter sp. B3I4]MDQ0755759.1 hypothetical protein [Arthrobacter sp. B3I4]